MKKITKLFLPIGMVLMLTLFLGASCDVSDENVNKNLGDGSGEETEEALGCCPPFCQETTEDACTNIHGGDWTSKSCAQVDECETSCCTPQCAETTKVECEQYGGTPNPGFTCEELDECKQGCCQPFGEEMLEIECDQRAGESWIEGVCTGYKASMSDTQEYYGIMDGNSDAKHEFGFEASTCDDSVNGSWGGSIAWLWTITGPGGVHTEPWTGSVSFTPDSSGNFTFTMGDTAVTGHVGETVMDVSFEMPGIVGTIEAAGPVTAGGACYDAELYN